MLHRLCLQAQCKLLTNCRTQLIFCKDTLQLKLALMEGPDFPIALGVIRDVDAPTYNDAVVEQIEEIKGKKKYHNFQELLMTNETWEVK